MMRARKQQESIIAVDSPEFAALMRIAACGGRAAVMQIMPAMWAGFQSTTRFHEQVGAALIRAGLAVSLVSGEYCLTNAGRQFIGRYRGEMKPAALASTGNGSKVAALMRQAGTLRPGALDYRNYPSMMGGQRVAYHMVRGNEEVNE